MTTENVAATQKDIESEKEPGGGIYPWLVVGILLFLNIFAWLDRQIIVLLMDPIRADLGITDVQVSLLTGFAFALLYVFCGVPLAWLADKFSRRWVLFFGVTLWSLATASGGLASHFWHLFAGRLFVGVGNATFAPSAFSILADNMPARNLGLASAITSSASAFGIWISLTIGGYIASTVGHGETVLVPLIGEMRAWQFAFLIVGLPGPVLALLVFALRERKRSPVGASSEAAAKPAGDGFFTYISGHWKFYACHMFGMAFLSCAFHVYVTWGPLVMTRVMEWSPAKTGATFGAFLAPGILGGQVLGGMVVDHFYRNGMKDAHLRLYSYAALIALPISLFAITNSNPWVLLVGILAAQLIIMGSSGAGLAAMQIITPPAYRARTVSIYMFITTMIGVGVGPLFVAALTQYVFQDDKAVGFSLAVVYACFYPLAALLLWKGAKLLRDIQRERGL